MAVIVSDSRNAAYNQYLSTANGFYRAEAYNLGAYSSTTLAVSTIRYITVTFANSGNIAGIVLGLYATALYNSNNKGVKVTLQENVATVWTDRVSKELTCAEINPEHSSGGNSYVSFFVNFQFATPYTVDTSAGKWRFKIENSTAGSTSIWSLQTSDTTNPSYVAYSETQISANDTDTLIVADKVIIDKSITLNGLAGTGETTVGVAGWVCRSTDISKEGICLLEWDSTPASSYTLTLGGPIMVGSFSGFRVGTSTNRIPNAQQAIITTKSTPDYGTFKPGFMYLIGTNAARSRGKTALFLYGEIPTKPYGILASDAASGQANIVTTEDLSSNWQPNDYVYVGRQTIKGQGTVVWQQIQSISGTTITLTSNLLTNNRLAGGTVINRDRGYGIYLKGYSNSAYLYWIFEHPNYMEMSGVKWENTFGQISIYASNYMYPPLPANRAKYIVEDNLFLNDATNIFYAFYTFWIPPEGCDFQRNLCFRTTVIYQLTAYYTKQIATNPFYSGTFNFKYNRICAHYSGAHFLPGTTNNKSVIENNVFENSSNNTAVLQINGLGTTFKNNYIYGSSAALASAAPTIYLGSGVSIRLSNNTIRNCVSGYGGLGLSTLIDIKSTNDYFIENTSDITYYGFSYYDVLFESPECPSGSLVFDDTYLTDAVGISSVKITDENNTVNVDKERTPIGFFTRCGDGLTDTTVHTSGTNKFSLRYEPKSEIDPLIWEQFIPTGNIQNKTMSISVWVKINSATYYAGTHINPTLTVDYDNGTTITSVATNSTSWQLLTCSFSPTTTYGRIKVSIGGATDALTTDAYFYVDDISVFLPPGVQLDLGGMDLWAGAKPITPSIATNVTASDVWNILTSSLTTNNSIGKHIIDNLDTTISSRLAGSSYTAPDNAGIAAIPTNPVLTNDSRLNNLDATISSRSTLTVDDIPEIDNSTIATAVRNELATELARIDEDISSRLANTDYTEPDNDNIDFLRKITGNKITRVGDILTIYEDDGTTIWKQYNVGSLGRIEI